MSAASLGSRFMETTRGQMVSLLRRGARTVEDLAGALGLTDNAIRNHLATLERDGIVRPEGVRRGPGAGKPAVVYELHPDAETLFSNAYVPVLRTLVDVMVSQLSPEQTDAVLRQVGDQLAKGAGGKAKGDLNARVRAAAAVLTSLGGDVDVVEEDGTLRIRGSGCPLAATVADHPQVCCAVETLVAGVTGAAVQSQCQHGARPRCCFAIQP
ncbi:MAG: ArsR family transcriptional regulator [bacterium]